jgi:cytochrome c1
MSDNAATSLPPNLLSGSKLTDFFMEGQTPPEEAPQGEFTKPPPSVSEAQASTDEPINAQQASVQETAPEPEQAGEKGVLEALPEQKGQKEKPYLLTDLPEDRFIEIKVDGAKEVVSLRELASGHIRRRAFNKFANQANAAADEALRAAETAVSERERVRQRVQQLFTNPGQLLKYMLEHQPDTAEKFARAYAEIWDGWQKNPDARRQHEWDRQQRQLAEQRRKIEQERVAHERRMAEEQAATRELERLKPVMQRAMREIGFPKITPKFRETVNVLCEAARRANGGKLDAEDLREAIHQANRLHPADAPVQARRPAPVAPAPARPQQPRPNGKGKDWSNVPYNVRMGDPDFFLRG